MKNMAPNNANISSTTSTTPADRDAERNSRSGSSGCLVRCAQHEQQPDHQGTPQERHRPGRAPAVRRALDQAPDQQEQRAGEGGDTRDVERVRGGRARGLPQHDQAAYLRSVHDHDDEIIEVLARREGVDPVADRRPRVLAAVIGALVFLANKDWQASDTESPEDLAAAFDAYADAVLPALAGHWT